MAIKQSELSEAAAEARRRYWREYYKDHKDDDARRKAAYWERRAAKSAELERSADELKGEGESGGARD